MSLVHDGTSNNVSKPELGEEFTKALELGGYNLTEKVKLLRKQLPQMSWDQDILVLGQEVANSGLITPELKQYVKEAVRLILAHMIEFSELAKKCQFIKFPLKYLINCSCSALDNNMEKYILAFSDAALSSEPKMGDLFGPKMGLGKGKAPKIEFNFGFMSTFIYFAHKCKDG